MQAAACCACGTAGSLLYLSLIAREVERLPSDYESDMLAAKEHENWLVSKLWMWALAYRCAPCLPALQAGKCTQARLTCRLQACTQAAACDPTGPGPGLCGLQPPGRQAAEAGVH